MKELIVNLDHTTRRQISILACTEEDAAKILRDIYLGTDLLDDYPIVSRGCKIICGDAKIVLPTIRNTSNIICDDEDDDFCDAEDGEESEGRADAHVARALQKEGDEHEDTDGEKDEGEIVVSSVTFGIVEEVNNYPSDEGIDGETDDEVHHGLCQL